MQHFTAVFQILFATALLPYAIAVLMPSWRWLAGCVVVVGCLIAALWIGRWITVSQPGYQQGFDYDIALYSIVTLGFAAGAMTRALTLWLAARGWSRALTTPLNIAGLFMGFGIALVPAALEAWERRAPSLDCANSVFKVDVAGARLVVPVSPFFNIYSGDRTHTDAHYLWSNPHVRALCAQTAKGMRAARATNISLDIDSIRGSRAATCDKAPIALRESLCAALPKIRDGRMLESDFPLNARVFAPDEIETRYFGGTTRSTYEDSLDGRTRSPQGVFLQTDATTPDGKPLTFACGEGSLGYVCRVAYPWVGGAHLSYGFHAPASVAIEKGLRVDAVMRSMFDAMRAER